MNAWKLTGYMHLKLFKHKMYSLASLGFSFCFMQQSTKCVISNSKSTFTESVSVPLHIMHLKSWSKMVLPELKDTLRNKRWCSRGLERCPWGRHACWTSLWSWVWVPAPTLKGRGMACACKPSAGEDTGREGRSQSVRDPASNEWCGEW